MDCVDRVDNRIENFNFVAVRNHPKARCMLKLEGLNDSGNKWKITRITNKTIELVHRPKPDKNGSVPPETVYEDDFGGISLLE